MTDEREPCTCTIACQGQQSLDAEGTDRICRQSLNEDAPADESEEE